MEKILIGTSGYDYPEWKGVFYPENISRKDFLPYYTTQFNALELNSSFYSMPTVQRMGRFIEQTDGRLNFSVKANRLLTHEISQNWKKDAEEFKVALKLMNEKGVLGAILFQFPQSFHYIPENRFYLAHIIDFFDGYPVVIEFRHKEWIKKSVFEGIANRKASIAFCDMPNLKNLPYIDFEKSSCQKILGEQFYVRLHGRNAAAWYANGCTRKELLQSENIVNLQNSLKSEGELQNSGKNGSSRYDYDYTDEELMKFVPIVQAVSESDKQCRIFFNNHPKGNGARNAMKLSKMLGK